MFNYFLQVVKRYHPDLANLTSIRTDEETGMSNGFLSKTSSTNQLLGAGHVKDNVERKLAELNFPATQKRRIMTDIFGGPAMGSNGCLVECNIPQEFEVKVKHFKQEWRELKKSCTRNNPVKFVDYFEKHKEAKIKACLTKYVREAAGITGVYGQNPIEWLHFLSKQEINDAVRASGATHRDASLTVSLEALKGRNIRLYSDAVKSLYGEGPFRVATGFCGLLKSYDEWKDMDKEERSIHLSRFLSAKQKITSTTSRSVVSPVTKKEVPVVLEDAKTLSIKTEEACIPEESVRLATLQDIFLKAEFLLNQPGAITKAASDDTRMRTVKSRSGGIPLIIQPLSKNKNLFTCQCAVFKGLGLCADTAAVAEEQGLLFEYLVDLRAKLAKKKGKSKGMNITSLL